MQTKHRKYLALAIILLSWGGWGLLMFAVGPKGLIDYLGLRNSYIVAFALAVLGGVSSFTAGPFYSTIITLGAGGASIPLLAVTAGIGLAISDSIFYLFGNKGEKLLSENLHRRRDRLVAWIREKPRWVVPILAFLYISLAPLPNDLLMLSLAASKYPYRNLLPAILFGDITAILILAYLAQTGVRWLE